jgi:ankyrin repeat protein
MADDDVRATDEKGQTALHHASLSDKTLPTARRLLSNGADVNAQDKYGWTPLHVAAYYGSARVADLLLAEGADPLKVTRGGDTAYLIALAQGHKGLLPQLKHDLIQPGDFTSGDTSTAASLAVSTIKLPEPAPTIRYTGRLTPHVPAKSAIFKGLIAGRKRTTRKRRTRKQWTSSATRTRRSRSA